MSSLLQSEESYKAIRGEQLAQRHYIVAMVRFKPTTLQLFAQNPTTIPPCSSEYE